MTPAPLNRRVSLCLVGCLAVLIATATPGGAAPGDLDPTFDGDGKVTTDLGGDSDGARAVAIQPDGKIVAAGSFSDSATSEASDFALARYNSDGSLDGTFDGDGNVTTDFASRGDEARAVAVQPDGKIVAAGFSRVPGGSTDFALARYNPDGSLDSTFGGNGTVTTDFASDTDEAFAVAIQGDRKIVAAGYRITSERFGYDFALARYNPDGSLDPSFGGNGKVATDFARNLDFAFGLAIQPNGRIVAAGSANLPGTVDFALARYNPDGSLDFTFGGNGKVTTDFSSDFATTGDYANAVAVQGDGKIVTAGNAIFSRDFDFALARYNSNGSLDVDFHHDGTLITDLGSANDFASGLAIQRDQKIVVGGYTSVTEIETSFDFALVRYNPDGFLDAIFGGDGQVITDFTKGSDGCYSLAVQGDGKIVAVGSADGDFGVARYAACRRTTRPSPICR